MKEYTYNVYKSSGIVYLEILKNNEVEKTSFGVGVTEREMSLKGQAICDSLNKEEE